MKTFYALTLFLLSGSGIATAGTVFTAIWNGTLNQEWTYGVCSGSNLSAPPTGNSGFYCGSTSPYLPNVPVIQTNWSITPPYLPPPGQPLPPGNSDPGNSANYSFNVTIGSGAGVVTLGDPAYNNCPTNNCISSGLEFVSSLTLGATSGLKIYGTLEIQPQGDSSATLINSGEVILPGIQNGGLLVIGGTQPASISGGGLITLSGGTLQAGTLTSDNTIHGFGLVYTGGALTNTGVINADAASLLTLQYGSIVNQGSILSTSTGGLYFASAAPIDNTAGLIQASNGSNISVFGATITGGTINLSNSGSLTLTGATITGGTLDLGAGSIVTITGQSATSLIEGVVSAPTGSQIQVGSYSNLVLTSNGSYSANGSIQIANQAELLIEGKATLNGSGTLTLGGPSAYVSNYGNNATLVTGSGFTFTGTGTVEVGLQNNGLIVADSGDNLVVRTLAGDTNAGSMVARNGGALTIVSPDLQPLSNSGQITAAAGGTLYLGGGGSAVISGGTVSTTGNGAIVMSGAILGNLALNNSAQGTISIGNSATVYFESGLQLTNNGTFTLSNSSALIIDSAMTFQNSGAINLTGLGGYVQNIMYLDGGLTLDGAGSFYVDGGSLVVGSNTLDNNGNTVTVGPTGQLGYPGRTGGLVDVNDYVQTAGTTIVLGTLQAQEIDLEGGSLEGVGGTIIGNLVNSGGTINPGDPGPMDIQGNFTETAGGMVVLDIDSASIYDTLSITGSANLGGTLELDFEGGFVPFNGEIFNLLSWGAGETGAFSSISIEGLSGFSFTPILGSNGFSAELDANPTPEPGTWMLALGAGIGLAFLRGTSHSRTRRFLFGLIDAGRFPR